MKRALYDIFTRLHEHPCNPQIDDLLYASTQGLFQPGASMALPPYGNPMWLQRDTHATPPPPWLGGYRNELSGYGPSNYNSSHIGHDKVVSKEFSMRLLCPTGRIGGAIGKSGASVRQLEHDTQARIQVEGTSPEAEEQIMNISSREVMLFNFCTIS